MVVSKVFLPLPRGQCAVHIVRERIKVRAALWGSFSPPLPDAGTKQEGLSPRVVRLGVKPQT